MGADEPPTVPGQPDTHQVVEAEHHPDAGDQHLQHRRRRLPERRVEHLPGVGGEEHDGEPGEPPVHPPVPRVDPRLVGDELHAGRLERERSVARRPGRHTVERPRSAESRPPTYRRRRHKACNAGEATTIGVLRPRNPDGGHLTRRASNATGEEALSSRCSIRLRAWLCPLRIRLPGHARSCGSAVRSCGQHLHLLLRHRAIGVQQQRGRRVRVLLARGTPDPDQPRPLDGALRPSVPFRDDGRDR